jgi:hypothetical protein
MHAELNKVVAALGEFYSRETHVLEKDLGERTLTHRLGVHLEKQFAGWDVDCDYNRLGERTLRLPKGSIVSTDDRSESPAIRISWCISAPFPTICWPSRSGRQPITSRSNMTGTSCEP